MPLPKAGVLTAQSTFPVQAHFSTLFRLFTTVVEDEVLITTSFHCIEKRMAALQISAQRTPPLQSSFTYNHPSDRVQYTTTVPSFNDLADE